MSLTMDLSHDLDALRLDREMAALFVGEAREHLTSIETLVLRLEESPHDRSLLDALYRPFHTIKGNASAIGAATIARLAHAVESLLDDIRSGRRRLGSHDVDRILKAVDELTGVFERLDRGLEEGAARATATNPARPEHAPDTASIKVDLRRLDTLVDLAGELVILHAMIRDGSPDLRDADTVPSRQFTKLGRLISEMQRVSLSARTVSLDGTFRRMARALRDVSHACGKPIDVNISGKATELDRQVIEQIADPLLHLVRNAVDHGVEDQETRTHLGKPARGQIGLRASHQEAQVLIEVSDDGRGLDPAVIRAQAIARGLIADTDALSESQVVELIFEPGFSTAPSVTDVSGRGVGMDVVRRNVEALGGRIDIRTAVGEGTTFALKLPLTMAVVRGVLIAGQGERFVLPAATLREAFRRSDCDVHDAPGGRRIASIRGRAMPIVNLATLLGFPERSKDDGAVVLTIEADRRAAAVVVDHVSGVQEFVVKALAPRHRVRGISGGAVLGDGRVGLILDIVGLLASVDEAAVAA